MKNLKLFPLSRNRYFPGKQLVTRDMEAEQRYFNNKRRLLNSLLHGSGIVCGLGVTAVERKSHVSAVESNIGVSVAVEPGLAIDGKGREIVVPEQVYLRLSDLDGFSADSGLVDCVYLCVEYAEAEREPMHSILNSATADDSYNRVEEAYRFYLTYAEPVKMPPEKQYANEQALRDEYYGENLEKRLGKRLDEKICLAGIRMIRWDNAYAIDEVTQAPFGQYVMSAALSADLCATSLRILQEAGHSRERCAGQAEQIGSAQPELFFQQGTLTVNIPMGIKSGGIVFSDESPHGLGAGPVFISVGLKSDGGAIYGANGIFTQVRCEYAVKTDESAGTFKIGVKALSPRAGRQMVFSWLAVKDPASAIETFTQPYLVISPATVRLPIRGTAQLSCIAHGIGKESVVWSVREAEGGSIGKDGLYRAPNTPGVYEITAYSSESPDIRACAFVVVSEK